VLHVTLRGNVISYLWKAGTLIELPKLRLAPPKVFDVMEEPVELPYLGPDSVVELLELLEKVFEPLKVCPVVIRPFAELPNFGTVTTLFV
jgi:hypothetical protein